MSYGRATVTRHEPGLRFWLDYVAREGALVEGAEDQALVILPKNLQQAFGLGEEVRVTADPDVAAEEGALLLIPGHPILDEAASRVLARGDAGCRFLPWPRNRPPDPAGLLERARAHFAVEHGRIDAAGEPAPVYIPLLRAGAVVVYTIDHRFQEQEEAWVDARSGLPLPEPTCRQGKAAPFIAAADTDHPVLAPDFLAALGGAHAALNARAVARAQALARQSQGVREEERARAEAYYADVLAVIARRREAATPDRQALFDAQADATRIERDRRLEEIDEKFRVRHEIHPFRLQLVLAPSLCLPVHIRRGERLYPLTLTWFLPGGCFASVRCPHCGAPASLVAGRERLGCAGCLPRPAAAPVAPPRPGPPPQPRDTAAVPRQAAPPPDAVPANGRADRRDNGRAAASERNVSKATAKAASGTTAKATSDTTAQAAARIRRAQQRNTAFNLLEGLAGALAAQQDPQVGRILKMGEKLATAFWQRAVEGKRWPSKGVAPHSPLDVFYRLYGPAGPFIALGLKPGALPDKVSAYTSPRLDWLLGGATTGHLGVGRDSYPFTLHWYARDGEAVVTEVLPYPDAFGTYLPAPGSLHPQATSRLFAEAPRPRAPLDAVAAVLWEKEIATQGLPFVVRCLAAWWCVAAAAGTSFPSLAMAAGVVSLEGRESGMPRTQAVLAADYGVRPAAVGAACRHLRMLRGTRVDRG